MIEIYLQDEGFEVLTVQTEQKALKKFEQEIYDVVIMDIRSKKCGGVSDY